MESTKLPKASLDDIVFTGRNRAYGAYLLRQIYNRHIAIASVIAVSLFLLFLSIPLISNMLKEDEEVVAVKKIVTEVDLAPPPPLDKATPPPPPPPPPDLPPPPPPVRSTIKFTPPVVKKDEEVQKQEVPDQKELEKTDVGTKTVKGDPTAPPDLGEIEGTGKVVAEVVEEKPYEYVEQMPTFPGGQEELLKYLAKNIKYPALAQRNNIQGTVYVRFTVTKTGDIADVEIMKDLGAGTGEEAARVVKTLPRFNPGKQNGRAVAVKYTVPVRFSIK
ncbi:MAG: TonB family protein [Hymenobacteraceae bacterium]|nr:TonB family protein [Hymenobacteraceae bacterium]MDX5395374.1 TonB family protein [Hymenobacteraceae bacterium]MDX5442365.1 TonB family protein [Hymenobacteraceae bacterium]MDX5511425.1 TonB family protein [Hymenobacteraceae bacterium]